MEEKPNSPELLKPKTSHSQLWDVVSVMASVGIIFFMIFLVMQVNSLEQIVDEQNRLTQGIKDNLNAIPNKEVLTEVHYVEKKTFVSYLSSRQDNASTVRFPSEGPTGFEQIYQLAINNCPSESDGNCSTNLLVYARPNWTGIEGEQPFYLAETKEGGFNYFGPYIDDLNRLMREAKHIREFTDLTE